ncbi:hypothetical protein SKAU_G00339860 [Synaphobranchus kaupii]|uniref:Peptidase A2 domain-containing protein n=1 Tax=Synaphobranchus kaupii TaxID=118154 RepID=A0A9Q1EMZ4_SYNKA|nr:hypothetical protein SKAU_G00339860 [Synaphobranchus kaupii]
MWDGTSPAEGDRGTGAVDLRADPQEGEEGQGYDQLALHAFLRALTPERLRDHVSLAQPGSISEALIKTTRAEDTLAIRLGKASGLYLHCRLDGQACRALVDTGATISLVRPGVLHNTGRPQLPGVWTPTATPLTSVTGAKMAMRGKKEMKVSGQEVSHEFWLADIADSCIIGLDLLKRWGACVDVSRASITLGMETVALQSGPTPKPARRARHLATTARPASKLLQLATAPKPPSLTR